MSSTSATLRATLSHPVIDADGHLVESLPLLEERIREVAGERVAKRYRESAGWGGFTNMKKWGDLSEEQRRHDRPSVVSWWSHPTRAIDRATSFLPSLFHDRLDEFGIDFAIVYPSYGSMFPGFADEELRRAGCRALNDYLHEVTAPWASRMTVPAVIPMTTPTEAIEELEHAVNVLGSKAVVLARYVKRPIPALDGTDPRLGARGTWIDLYGVDSEYDYDPVWAKCCELGVAATTHMGSMGIGFRQSISSYVYNHVGQFAAAGEALAKALFLGGVTARFPELRFAFLEGGVAWGVSLLSDLAEHWKKRGTPAIHDLNPASIDRRELTRWLDEYGGEAFRSEAVRESVLEPDRAHPNELDDFARAKIEGFDQIGERFVHNFFFGCEADDRLVATAFDERLNPFGSRLRAMLGSDIGHWDVPDMREVVAESYQLVEQNLLSPLDFKDFVFGNAVQLHGGMNPRFFEGTVVEDQAREVLQGD